MCLIVDVNICTTKGKGVSMKRLHTFFATFIVISLFSINSVFSQQRGAFNIPFPDQQTNEPRKLSMYVPENYDGAKSYPLVIAIHGFNMASDTIRDWLLEAAKDQEFILMCPDENQTQNGSIINQGLQIVDYMYNTDANKCYITGYLWGGEIAYYLGLNSPQVIKGIIGISPIISQLSQEQLNNINAMPLATIMGADEVFFNETDQLMKQIQSVSNRFKYIVKEGVSHPSPYYYSSEFTDDWISCYYHLLGETPPEPGAVRLDYPLSMAEDIYHEVVFKWMEQSGASAYDIQISDDDEFSNIIESSTVQDIFYAAQNLTKDMKYFWRVRCYIDGEQKPWSSARYFTTAGDKGYIHSVEAIEEAPFNGESRDFSFYVPDSYTGDAPFKLILGFHGGGRTAADFVQIMQPYGDSRGAIVVCPDGKDGNFYNEFNGLEMNIAETAIKMAVDKYNIDEESIYFAGWSLGGRAMMIYGLEHHDRFKGIIGLSPAFQSISDANNGLAAPWPAPFKYENAANMPICMITGSNDYFRPNILQAEDNLNDIGGPLLVKDISGANHDVFNVSGFNAIMEECFDFIDNPTSVVEEFHGESLVNISPNPAGDFIKINIDDIVASAKTVSIYNLNGEELYNSSTKGNNIGRIDLAEFPAGIYILKINCANRITVRKFIKAE